MMDGLKDVHREAVIATIAANERVERAVLFGSRATGTNTVSSDVDIALFGERLTMTDQARLAAALDEIPMAQSVDLLLYNSIRDRTLREHIRRRGVELYARPSPPRPSHRTRPVNRCPDLRTNDIEAVSRWRRRHVRDLIRDGFLSVGDGYRAKNSELSGSGLPFARAGNIADGFRFAGTDRYPEDRLHRIGDKISRLGDVVFTSKGTVGRFAIVRRGTERFVYSPQLCFWRSLDPEIIDPYFLYCWIRGPEFFEQFRGVAGQTDMAEYVSLTDQRRMFITLPPVAEQRTIANILCALDDKIELNRRMTATLEAISSALFRAWFVDFDPVRDKMEGRDTGLPKEIAALFPDRLVDSELDAIPVGWPVESLADHFEVAKGVSYKGSGLSGNGTPLHNLNSIQEGGGYKYEGIKFYSGEYAERHRVRPGDAIVANTEQGHDRLLIGYAAIVPGAFGTDGIASHHIYRLRSHQASCLSNRFLVFLLNSRRMHDLVSGYANGTTVNMLPIDGVQQPRIQVPPRALVDAFDIMVSCSERRREQIVRESQTLSVLRDELLPRLVSGELRVPVDNRSYRDRCDG